MDIEKTMEFLLEQQSRFDSQMDRLSEFQIQAEERQASSEARHDTDMAAIRAELRRAVRFSVEESRREREQRHKLAGTVSDLDANMAKLAATLQQFIESLKHKNGS